MKHSATKPQRAHNCPVRCPACHYDDKIFPARWNRAELKTNQFFSEMIRSSNHILFLMKGTLHVRTLNNDNHYLTAGQCMFFARKETPEIEALASSEVIWLDFSNRIILYHLDTLSTLVSSGCSCRGGMPVLPLHPQIKKLLQDMHLLESPCYHLLKQYDLFIWMTCVYTKKELAGFFQSILRPVDDLKAFVISNYKNMEGVEDFASHAKMSRSCFIRKFREAFGMTIHQWMVKQKKKDLCAMIRNGQQDTKAIALRLGMNNPACLYQFCRKHFGCTISELMADLSKNNQLDKHNEDF